MLYNLFLNIFLVFSWFFTLKTKFIVFILSFSVLLVILSKKAKVAQQATMKDNKLESPKKAGFKSIDTMNNTDISRSMVVTNILVTSYFNKSDVFIRIT